MRGGETPTIVNQNFHIMTKIKSFSNREDAFAALDSTSPTYLVGTINGISYDQLVGIFGEPAFPETSDDGKTNREWVVEFDGNIFTIYDWKTYDVEYTVNRLRKWNIGGNCSPNGLVDAIGLLQRFVESIEIRLHGGILNYRFLDLNDLT